MKLGLLFPGQGEIPSLSTVTLWREHDKARQVWEHAERILNEPIREWLAQGKLGDTRRAQILSVVGSLATYKAFESIVGIKPDVLMGHSVGEIAALSVACRLDLETTLRIVDARGRAMQSVVETSPPMAMAALIDPPADLNERLNRYPNLFVANYNSESQVVVSGYSQALKEFVDGENLRAIPLDVAGAFHTPLMAVAASQFRSELESMELAISAGSIVVSNRSALPFDTLAIEAELAEQMVSPVRWADGMRWSYAHGVQRVVDLSSSGMLARMSGRARFNFSLGGSLLALTEARQELRHLVSADSAYDLAARGLGKIVSTRNENPDPDVYRDVVIPGYQRIRALVGQTDVDAELVLALVAEVLKVKGVPDGARSAAIQNLRWHAGLALSAE